MSLVMRLPTLVNEEKSAGSYEVDFDARNLPSGIYILYQLKTESFVQTRNDIMMIRLKALSLEKVVRLNRGLRALSSSDFNLLRNIDLWEVLKLHSMLRLPSGVYIYQLIARKLHFNKKNGTSEK